MLPYRLRPAIGGKKKNGNLKSNDTSSDGGGPVQLAIEKDLTDMQTRFVKTVLELSSQKEEKPGFRHSTSGQVFGVFKQEFTESKMAMMHLLLPLNTCDKEAYSQLIYAACLEIFRKAFHCQDFSLEYASFAIFSLYALFETNPLPRELNSPLELLPTMVQAEENFQGVYRRAFSQKIRIDHYHYLLVLQLRERCLERIAECGKQFYEAQSLEQQEKNNDSQTTMSWKCNCGIARDTIQVLDRLSLKFDYCEYTGPVGLEAYAGHPNNENNNDSSSSEVASTEQILESFSTEIHPFEYSSELKASLRNYQSKIKEILVPEAKSKLSTATRLRKDLETFFSSLQKDPWGSVEARLFETALNHETTSPRIPFRPALQESKEEENSYSAEKKNEASVSVIEDQQPVHDKSGEESIDISAYKIILPNDLGGDPNHHLQQVMKSLLQRERPVILSEEQGDLGINGDDVSSIGIGGISVATGRGRNALQTLLSVSRPRKVPKFTAIPSSTGQALSSNNSTNFLDSEQVFGLYADNDDDNDYDSSSVVSNISLSDYEDDERNKCDASVATSAAGKQALQKLLKKVKKNDSKSRKQKATGKRKAKPMKGRPQKIAGSISSSIGAGNVAIGQLLNSATMGKNKARSPKSTLEEMPPVHNSTLNSGGDALSTASSIGHGQGALDILLSKVGGNQQKPKGKKKSH